MNNKQKARWEKLRTKGKRHVVISQGVIGWGVPTAILFTFIVTYMEHSAIIFDRAFLGQLITALILFPIGGIAFGLWIWNFSEKSYKKSIDNDNNS